jgi:tetratricopeptide (TPR) repeat protein
LEEAVTVLREVVKTNPEEADAFSYLGAELFALKRYSEAADADESAVKLRPDRPGLYVQLGSAYLHTGNDDKAVTTFKKAVEIDPRPLWFNNIAYTLATADKQMPLALDYAEKAVREEEEASAKIKLSDLKNEDLGYTPSLAAYWDTLGWVHFRMGNYEKAERYLNAAWSLSGGPVEADHLGQVYEKEGKKQAAIHTYQLALAVNIGKLGMTDGQLETRTRLEHLHPGASESITLVNSTSELSTMRTFKVAGLSQKSGTAEFFLLFGPG